MEILAIVLVFVVPAVVGFILARYCAHHCIAITVFILTMAVLAFASSVLYAAIPVTIVTTLCASIGYFIGRLTAGPDNPRGNA
jgi:uncharacterized membrane protein